MWSKGIDTFWSGDISPVWAKKSYKKNSNIHRNL